LSINAIKSNVYPVKLLLKIGIFLSGIKLRFNYNNLKYGCIKLFLAEFKTNILFSVNIE